MEGRQKESLGKVNPLCFKQMEGHKKLDEFVSKVNGWDGNNPM